MKNNLIIVAGCSGSGKTTVAGKILKSYDKGIAQIICLDRFYRDDRTKSFPLVESTGKFNFDHPDSLDWKLLYKCLLNLLKGKPTEIPNYNYFISRREKVGEKIKPTKVIILEGTLPLYDKKIADLASLKLFVKTPLDICLIRRMKRDQATRGRSIDSIVEQWQTAVRPMYEKYVYPSKNHADLILPWQKVNEEGLSIILQAIEKLGK